MKSLLNEFWEWWECTPEQYAEGIKIARDFDTVIFEDDFPYFTELIEAAKKVIDSNSMNRDELELMITVMAIDNEAESILEYIEINSKKEQLNKIVEIGVSHIQSEARWQIAELVYRRKPDGYMEVLKKLAEDTNSYVRKRAGNCISYLA